MMGFDFLAPIHELTNRVIIATPEGVHRRLVVLFYTLFHLLQEHFVVEVNAVPSRGFAVHRFGLDVLAHRGSNCVDHQLTLPR